MTPKSPAELAKETLLRLAEKRLPPTPEHFTRMYCTLAGIPEPIPERFQKLLDLPWHDLIRRLIAAWELPHREWTTEMKRRSLERVLATKNPERLFERLSNLVDAWKRAPTRDLDAFGTTNPKQTRQKPLCTHPLRFRKSSNLLSAKPLRAKEWTGWALPMRPVTTPLF